LTATQKIKKLLGWRSTPKPHITLNDEYYAQLAPFRLPLILTVLIMLVGTLGYMIIDHFPLMDAIYQTGITFTTVGFGEIHPISDAGRIFTITLSKSSFFKLLEPACRFSTTLNSRNSVPQDLRLKSSF